MTEETANAGVAGNPAVLPENFNWRDLAPDYKEKFPEIKDPIGLFKSYEGMVNKMGSPNDYLKRPGKDATAEQQAAFQKELNGYRGVPEKPEDYKFELKDDIKPFIDEASIDAFRPVAQKLGLDPAQAQGLAEWQGENVKQLAAQNLEKVQKEWGKDFDANLKFAGKFAEDHLDADFVKDYGADPRIALQMFKLAKKQGEGVIKHGDTTAAGDTKESLRQKAIEIQSRKEYTTSEALQKEATGLYAKIATM